MRRFLAVMVAVAAVVSLVGNREAMAQGGDPFGAVEKAAPPKPDPYGNDPYGSGAKPQRDTATGTPGQLESKEAARPASTNERVREALESPALMEFIDTPLQDAVTFLKDYHGIEIQLDERALKSVNVGSDTPVTRSLKGLPLKSALRLMLDEHGLTYVVHENVLLITTKQAASAMQEVHVYDVTELVDSQVKSQDLAMMLMVMLGDAPQTSPALPITLPQPASSAAPSAPNPYASAPNSYPGLPVATIPISSQRIRVVPLGNFLLIRASQADHETLAKLLAELKKSLDTAAE